MELQAFSKLIATCSMFAMYGPSFTRSANKAVDGLETEQDQARRWDTFIKFEANFNHW